MQKQSYDLSLTTQGPTYPPSEVMDPNGDFVVIGVVNRPGPDGTTRTEWGRAIVSAQSEMPPHGQNVPYRIVRELPSNDQLTQADRDTVLHTLPLPLPINNYPMLFAPEQSPEANSVQRPSYPFHEVPIPDLRPEDGRRVNEPITLGQWVRARGDMEVALADDGHAAEFTFEFAGLIPSSMYTVMSLRTHDLAPAPLGPHRPGPLGIPNVFMTDRQGRGHYHAKLPNPFPAPGAPGPERIVNVVLLWMSYQQNYGGAIGFYGLGGDIHAQLKLQRASFQEFVTTAE
ncbi:hypothetical protein OG455_11030 [Kitasatospora sp. NBC_01287]|uniref:hypothetical protein n=1 Tax=Kitasatospora sp. NBC_01287 TaxID=2903573 RepID=UPI002251974B|nr:hypothetical protein [Kitasatospora sp. NBC_01287]MCX4746047.1 hypothetical protein [Kitasatospora sp. NBC_01287]